MKSSHSGDYNTTSVLIKLGLNVNAQNNDGNTALHFASSKKHWRILELLLQGGANEKLYNHKRQTAWEIVE